eukprot:6914270-Lingulodinium_polyedra.AAC.1
MTQKVSAVREGLSQYLSDRGGCEERHESAETVIQSARAALLKARVTQLEMVIFKTMKKSQAGHAHLQPARRFQHREPRRRAQ